MWITSFVFLQKLKGFRYLNLWMLCGIATQKDAKRLPQKAAIGVSLCLCKFFVTTVTIILILCEIQLWVVVV